MPTLFRIDWSGGRLEGSKSRLQLQLRFGSAQRLHQRSCTRLYLLRDGEFTLDMPNKLFYRIAALWREGMNVKGHGWAARGA